MSGYRQREFHWSEVHRCFIYEGKEFSPAEFNAKFDKAIKNNVDFNVRVKVVDASESAAPVVAAPPPPAPREITLDEAEAVIQRLAPDRLKQKPGRKPASHIVVE